MRLLRYFPIVLPFLVRFARSPRGKAMLNRVVNRRGGATGSARR